MTTWTLTVDDIVPTANPFMRMHWGKRKKMAEAWNWLLTEQVCKVMPEKGSITPATRKRWVKMISYRTGTPDPQNLYLGHDKLILDQLVKLGVLVDDSARWCDFSVVSRKAGKRGKRTVIEIREG